MHQHRTGIGTSTLRSNINDYLKELNASTVRVDFDYPLFIEKITPVTKEKCLVKYLCTSSADFRPGRTIDPLRGDIIFPTLRPFDYGIRDHFRSEGLNFQDTSEYLYPQVYDTTVYWAQRYIGDLYVVRGRAQHSD